MCGLVLSLQHAKDPERCEKTVMMTRVPLTKSDFHDSENTGAMVPEFEEKCMVQGAFSSGWLSNEIQSSNAFHSLRTRGVPRERPSHDRVET